MSRFPTTRRVVAVCASASTLLLAVGTIAGRPALAASFSPSYFPAGAGFDGNAYSLQFSGANREGTAATIALDEALAGSPTDGYPFSSTTIENKTNFSELYGVGVLITQQAAGSSAAPNAAPAMRWLDWMGIFAAVIFLSLGATVLVSRRRRDVARAQLVRRRSARSA